MEILKPGLVNMYMQISISKEISIFLRLPYVRVIYLEEKKRTILVGK